MVSSQLLIMLSLSSQDTFMYVSILDLRKKEKKTFYNKFNEKASKNTSAQSTLQLF